MPVGGLIVLRILKSFFAVGALALLLAACSANPVPPASGLTHDAREEAQPVYRIGIGDKLKIVVFGEPDLSGEIEVGAGGALPMPLIGDVPARGLTVRELGSAIAAELEGVYLKDPKVSVQVLSYRSIFVHGEVKSGGELAFKNGLTIVDAIAMAGGYTYRADQSYVELRREGARAPETVYLDSAVPVLPGDNIQVPERLF